MKTGSLQWEQGPPVMKTDFSLWEKVHRENPAPALYWPCTGLQWCYNLTDVGITLKILTWHLKTITYSQFITHKSAKHKNLYTYTYNVGVSLCIHLTKTQHTISSLFPKAIETFLFDSARNSVNKYMYLWTSQENWFNLLNSTKVVAKFCCRACLLVCLLYISIYWSVTSEDCKKRS